MTLASIGDAVVTTDGEGLLIRIAWQCLKKLVKAERRMSQQLIAGEVHNILDHGCIKEWKCILKNVLVPAI